MVVVVDTAVAASSMMKKEESNDGRVPYDRGNEGRGAGGVVSLPLAPSRTKAVPTGNNDTIHRGGSSLAGGAATTTTTNNYAASTAESFLLTHDLNLPDNITFDYGAEEEEL
jgi:hypothetical protein